MFTGLVDSIGTIRHIRKGSKSVALDVAPGVREYEAKPGDSVSVNGVCLTVESIQNGSLQFTAVHETLKMTTLTNAAAGDQVNLERAMRPVDRLGGHIVQGHVDGVGHVLRDKKVGESIVRAVWVPQHTRRLMAPKGSVTINGVSLTIVDSYDDTITISLVPYTLAGSTMGMLKSGDKVNIECDVLARYVFHMLEQNGPVAAAGVRTNKGDLLTKLETFGF